MLVLWAALFLSAIIPPPVSTTTSLSVSPAASTLGQSVTLTATVNPSSATGRVVFYNGSSILSVSLLASGQASLTTSQLPVGPNQLRAYYAGDGNDSPSTSTVTTLVVSSVAASALSGPVLYNASSNGDPRAMVSGDFDGDGTTDLAVSDVAFNTVSILLGNGDGTFRSGSVYNTGLGALTSPYYLAVGDFNGDGKRDLVVVSGTVSLMLGNGDGTFQAPAAVFANPGGTVLVGDFNRDGYDDLAVILSGNSGALAVLLSNGNGTFQAPLYLGPGYIG